MISRIKRLAKNLIFGRKVLIPVYIPAYKGNMLCDKVALVTGETRGIGYAIAKSYICNGAQVCITGRSQKTIDEACIRLREETGMDAVFGTEMDMSNPSSFKDVFSTILAHLESKKSQQRLIY